MTRNEFWDDISSFSDIVDFCREYGYDHYIDDLYSRNQLFDYVVEGSDDISDLYGYLCDIGDLDADWFSVDGGEIRSLDGEDFDSWQEQLYNELDDDDFFEDDDDNTDEDDDDTGGFYTTSNNGIVYDEDEQEESLLDDEREQFDAMIFAAAS